MALVYASPTLYVCSSPTVSSCLIILKIGWCERCSRHACTFIKNHWNCILCFNSLMVTQLQFHVHSTVQQTSVQSHPTRSIMVSLKFTLILPISMLVPKLVVFPYITYLAVFIWTLVVSLFKILLLDNDHIYYFDRWACRTWTVWSGPVMACTAPWAFNQDHQCWLFISMTLLPLCSLMIISVRDSLVCLWLWLWLQQF